MMGDIVAMPGDPPAERTDRPSTGLDRSAFESIVRGHQSAVFAFCARRVGDPSLARDLTQEVFLTMWKARGEYTDRGRPRAYLLAVAHHRCLAANKSAAARRRLAAVADAQPVVPGPDPSLGVERRDARLRLEAALDRVDADRSEVLRLRFVDDLTPTEIASVLDLPVGTVKSRLHRGLADVRKELSRD